MTKLPRDVHGTDLARALRVYGYEVTRRQGSHIRLTTQQDGQHHVTVPDHKPIKTGTLLRGVLKPVAIHHHITVEELLKSLKL